MGFEDAFDSPRIGMSRVLDVMLKALAMQLKVSA